jgi:hypothetical protein
MQKDSEKTNNSIHCKTIEEFIGLTEDLLHEDIKNVNITLVDAHTNI